MITSLRARLFASYILLIVVTLIVITLALFLVLRNGSVLTENSSLRLYNLLNQIVATSERSNIHIPVDGPTRIQRQILNQLDKRLNVRVILFDSQYDVSYDSRRDYVDGSRLDVDSIPYIVPNEQTIADLPVIRGTLRNTNGVEWVFVAQDPTIGPAPYVMVAIRAPRTMTIPETIQYYGQNLISPILQAALIGLVVSFIMSLIITRSVAQPLQEVSKAAVSVASGNLDQSVPVRGPREVRTVAEAFNQMTLQVRETQQAQRDFLANVTHDLRTPLTSIQGFSQAIIEGVASNPTAAQRAAQIIYEEAGRLTRMVQELLDLARIEAGRFSMTRHSIPLTELLNSLGERLTPRAAEKGLRFVVDVPLLPPIAGDGDRLVQVYTNLVDNAIKHTPTGGQVVLRGIQHDNGILVMVADTGEGIPADDLPHVFDRFYQVDKSRHRERRDGVGLGLAITKGIVEAHSGKLWVESQEGRGTTFYTWFPVSTPDMSTISIRKRTGMFRNSKAG